MPRSTAEKRSAFRALHQDGHFVLPNPWDAGSARLLEHLGFQALASTSTGYAWTTGRPDYQMTRDEVLHHLTVLCCSVDLPVNADFESGFASDPEAVAANVTLAVATGVAGISIEDRIVGDLDKLYEAPMAVARIRAAREAIDRSGEDVILVGRTEGLLIDATDVSAAIDRLVMLADAGADCLYAPGVADKDHIAAMVRAVSPKPVNVLAMDSNFPGLTVAQLADLGVRRISIGGALAMVSWGAIYAAAEQLFAGSLDGLVGGMPGAKLNTIFAAPLVA
jgi:2-methylisocitrate lyase-like PEP mutase family enzyme